LPAPEESGPGGPEPEAAPLGSEAAPQEEAARPAAIAEVPAAVVAPDATAEALPAEPAVKEAVAAAEAAAPEVTSSAPLPVQEEPEVVYGRHLLPNLVEIPLARLLIKVQRAQEEAEVGFRWEWEKLEAECLRLSIWELRLGDRIKTVASRHAEERAQLEQERDDL
jgi:hypothetical protein